MKPARAWLWTAYAGFWLGAGIFFSLAEWQHYVQRGGAHMWEPFLWEISGNLTTGALAVAVYFWNDRLMMPGRGMPARIGGHVAGLAVFVLAHSALMYSLREIVYLLADVEYHPGSTAQVLAYEGAKEVVTYALLIGLSLGLRAFLREQRQAAEVARLGAHLAEARLARLQEQIQPHFLFNTLNLVSSVMHEDVERADRILAELADLLRQSMSASRVAVHSVAQEMRWVEPFLSIMRQRFGDRLRTCVEITDEAARCAVPALLLMAPVENAVRHGVARTDGEVQVEVLARVVGGQLQIDVIDTGAFDPLQPGGEGGGTGLANARARLATLHGADASLTLARARGETRVRVTLPATRNPA